MTLPRLIGIAGKAGAGKDTLANHLVDHHGFTKYSLAAPMKRILNERFGWTEEQWNDREWKETPDHINGAKRAPFGEQLLEFFSPRSWAQWLGSEVGRYLAGEDVWINLMEREWRTRNEVVASCADRVRMVVPDVRFNNEAARIQSLGGVVVRVIRSDAPPVLDHISERGVDDMFVNVQVSAIGGRVPEFLDKAMQALKECPRGV